MAKTYIAADMRLYDKDMAKKYGMHIEAYNNNVIKKINETIDNEEDYVLLCGTISTGSTIGTLHLISQIKAKKIIFKRDQLIKDNLEMWHKISSYMCETDGAQEADINGQHCTIIILASNRYLDKYLKLDNIYIVGAGSDLGIDEVYKKPLLNVSLENWNFCPLEIGERVPQIIDDMELFASMDENKEEILE